jgi:hypothetical protein
MKSYDIKDAAKEAEMSEVYLRRLILQGKVKTTKVNVSANVWKHMISEEDLIALKSKMNHHNTREDGRNRFVLYANQDELAKLAEFAKTAKLGFIVTKQNNAEYAKKRYVSLKAKKAQLAK